MATTIESPQLLVFLLCFPSFTFIVVLGQGEVPAALVSLSNVTDQFTLLSFKSLVTKDPYNVLSNWNSNISFCDWTGVSCSRDSHRVVALNLSGKALEGTISPYISNLSFLQVLDLSNDSFHGHLLMDFSRLPLLENLSIRKNNFEGLIPQTLSHCRCLQILSARDNQFYGSIPKSLGSLSELKDLKIRGNRLTGTIPVALANLTKLKWFSIADNQIQGTIPPELGSLTHLMAFSVQLNNLTGTLPESLFNLSALQVLSFATNQLVGHLPKDAGRFLPNLQGLYMGTNYFDGSLPASLSNATILQVLTAESNKFSGPIPLELGSLSQLRHLLLWGNMLTNVPGSRELSILTSFTRCRMLEEVYLSDNLLNGILPASVGNLTTTMSKLVLSFNQIEGTIPLSLANLTKLIALDLSSNKIKWLIPPNIGQMHSLEVLLIDQNALEGPIPLSFYQLVRMYTFNIGHNMLTGSISSSINNLTSLERLDLSSNNLSSTLPPGLCELKDLLELYLQDNSFTSHLPLGLGNFAMMINMDISANKLSGELPASLSKLQMLEYLNLSQNTFDGHIPEQLDHMLNLVTVDLSHNKLSGEIPKSLEKLQHIQVLDLSFNLLEGEIPSGGKFANLSAESFLGNYALCGAPKFHVSLRLDKTERQSKSNAAIVFDVFAFGGYAFFVIVCTLCVISCCRKTGLSKCPDDIEKLRGITLPVISYKELLHATSNFSDANLLGSGSFGSVYKAILADGATVAVKVLNLSFEGASKSFDVECTILRQIRHRNLVKVITSCSNEDFKALVLQYMPLGSLDVCLHSGGHHLNLFQRLDIMIDVACALEYLHHGYLETIVHCDVKPSNVLLDENMTAHLGDFGIAKILIGLNSSTLTATLGTSGYIAPEFGMAGMVSAKADVYSYGILILEVFTGRKPTDEQFDGDFSLRQWVAERSAAMDELLVMIMEIGLLCSSLSPNERLDMKEVVVRLRRIRQKARMIEG
ncbi:LRR receptor-like serine/threonine-protein kinase EFR [Nymphaea colorata]|nr:LRR receptor-like serine/threonine-protein kinase EFR [Nymphaea colorata]